VGQKDGRNSLVVGSDDLELRVYNGDEVMCHMTETAPAVQLVPTLTPGRFAYALSNGTVGVYDKQARTWRYKSKSKIESIAACDVDFDGVAEILCGWSNGKFEVRSDAGQRDGMVTYKDKFDAAVTNIISADYRGEGRPNPLVCSFDGECRGYVAVETAQEEVVVEHDHRILEKLMQEKQSLQFELTQFQRQLEMKTKDEGHVTLPTAAEAKVACKLRPNAENKAIDLVLTVGGGAILQGCTVTADVIFGAAESLFITADQPSETLVASFKLEKDIAADLKVAAMVGFPGADCFQCHEMTIKLPKFAMYVPVKDFGKDPEGAVTARVNERVNRLIMWAQSCFNGYAPAEEKPAVFEARFYSLRDGNQLMIQTTPNNGGELIVRSDSMDTVGEVISDLGTYLGLTELNTTAEFPKEFATFQEVLVKVEEYNAVRMKLTAEMADSTQLVKALVIKAEDARIQNDMSQMKKMYGSLYEVNRELMGEFLKRSNNHNELLAALKDVNSMIQKASKFRLGQARATLVTECRNAIRQNQMQTLFNIIRTGKP
jgi:Bardet-Biedl syndrome 2 protein